MTIFIRSGRFAVQIYLRCNLHITVWKTCDLQPGARNWPDSTSPPLVRAVCTVCPELCMCIFQGWPGLLFNKVLCLIRSLVSYDYLIAKLLNQARSVHSAVLCFTVGCDIFFHLGLSENTNNVFQDSFSAPEKC